MSESTSKSRIDSILDAVDASIITIDQAGCIVDCNEATTRMFGYSQSEMISNNIKMLMPAPYRQEHDAYLNNHMTTGVNRIIGIGRQVRGLHRSGAIFPIHLSVAKYVEKSKTYFTGILHDLSELEEAKSVSQRLGQIVDESVSEIYTFEVESLKFTGANRAALKNLGYTLDQLKGMTPVDIVLQLTEESLRNTVKPLLDNDTQRVSLNTTLVRRNGSHYEAEVTLHLSPAFDPPELAAIVQDVTDKNRMIESLRQNQKIESIGNLTGGIAHDFNNILTVIIGNLDLLEIEHQKPDDIELLDEVRDAAHMGARLTKRLLSFARRSPLSPNIINVNSLIDDLKEMLSRTLGGNIELEIQLGTDLWLTSVDISTLENALVNLAINARDAMPEGGRLTIATDNCALDDVAILGEILSAGDYVRITVSDTGTGIPKDLRDTLFEPFVTSKTGGNGTGLGLSMVYGFVHQSGGTISVQTQVDEGAAFSMYLPRNRADSGQTEGETAESPLKVVSNKIIIVAEDDDRVRKLTVRRLEALGHKVLAASNGHDALALFKANPTVDLVFTDVVMTEGMSGYDLALAVQQLNSETPVLLTSAFAQNTISDQQLETSGLPLLRKPYHQNELGAFLEALLSDG